MKRLVGTIFFSMLFMMAVNGVRAQRMVDTVPYCCDFENFVEQGFWRPANSTTNKWVIGNATSNGGNYSLYISNDNGLNHYYSTSSTSYNYETRQLYMPAGGIYEVSYDWECYGESSLDFIRAFLVPEGLAPAFYGGSNYYNIFATGAPSGWIAIDGGNKLNLSSSWQTYSNPLLTVPTTGNYYLLFFWHCDASGGTMPAGAIDNICINPVTCPQPTNLTKTDLAAGIVSLDWSTVRGNADPDCGWIVEWDTVGFTPGTGRYSATTMTKPFTVTGLREQETYTFYVRAICCDSNGNDTSRYSVPYRFCASNGANNCPIDFTDLSATGVTCTYGEYMIYNSYVPHYSGPYANVGVIDSGYMNIQSRHTVHTDMQETDARTGNRLLTIPNGGYCESVRLGNWLAGRGCESIAYNMLVDTNDFDLLLLQYAIVMDNPNAQLNSHSLQEQPRFTMEIMDVSNNLIDTVCGFADFNAMDASASGLSAGWHDAISGGAATPSSYMIYKDWTPVGINLSDYHGQHINVRFTNFDCGQGAHYGYTYFTLGCQKARILSNSCRENAMGTTLTAPAGFNYRWYTSIDTTQTISTSRTIVATMFSAVYYCEVSFIGASSCKFTLSARAIPRFPHSKFVATIDTESCQYKINVRNRSYVSGSASDTNAIDNCEEYYWDWGDGESDNRSNPGYHIYGQPGNYTIMLVSSVSGGQCHDTAYYTVSFNPPVIPTIHGDSLVCAGTLARVWVDCPNEISCRWNNGQVGSRIDVYPTDSVTYKVHVTDYIGCETDLSFHVEVDTVPLPILQPNVFESCVPYKLTLADMSPYNSTNTYSWIWGDNTVSTSGENSPTHYFRDAGEFTMKCCIESSEGCLDTVDYQVYVYDFAKGEFSWSSTLIMVNDPTAQFINLTRPHKPTNRYHWEFFNHDGYQDFSDEENPIYTWTGEEEDFIGNDLVRLITTDYVTTHSGATIACVDTVENNVFILSNYLQFPNVVTSNGDGINDIFEIKNLLECGAYTDTELTIFNHWGRMVYHVKNISKREDFWDPAANGDVSGTYYYRFTGKSYNGNMARNGVVQVLSK